MSQEIIQSLEPGLRDRLTNQAYEWNRLDYTHDAIFEASAGTGKTYALESIVMKLVLEKDIGIRNILLVTYTEKAAGELKDRVRAALTTAGHLPPDFDEATICTIHSFCRELLTEYAFENRVPMQTEVSASDDDLIHQAVRRVLDDDGFISKYGKDYGAHVLGSGYADTSSLAQDAENLIRKTIAKGACPDEPSSVTNEMKNNVALAAQKVQGLLKGEDFFHWALSGFVLNGNGRANAESRFQSMSDLFVNLLDANDDRWLSTVIDWKSLNDSANNAFNPLVTGHGRGARLLDFKPELKALIDALSAISDLLARRLKDDLAQKSFLEYQRLKKLSSRMTFDDMVTEASRVIGELKEGDALLTAIRRKYRIALVDEFQDTDDKQWTIFRKIFSSAVNTVDAEGPLPWQGFLLAVGDPKQAIYSFRGADIGTYLKAREEIAGSTEASPWRRSLGKTYRSTPQMVDAFNSFFSEENWFGDMKVSVPGADGTSSHELPVTYSPVDYPKGGDFEVYEDHPELCSPVALLESVRPGVSVGKNGGFGNNASCLPTFMENAAHEIRRLMSGPSFPIYDKREKRNRAQMRYGDFCILVRTGADAAIVKHALAQAKIPYGHYKEAGVFATVEAESLLALFDFLANPGGKGNLAAVLLTPLFGIHPRDLADRLAEQDAAFNARVDQWREMALKREWNALFESVMNDTDLSHPRQNDYEFDRRWATVRQILDRLLIAKGHSARTVDEFAELLRAWRRDDTRAGEGGSLRQKESDANRVQIMTMHASKGLEFPVVFIAYGFSGIDRKEFTEEEKIVNRQEMRRLLYVAITRAKYRVYLPWTQRGEGEENGVGSTGSALRRGFLAKGILRYFADAAGAKAAVVHPRLWGQNQPANATEQQTGALPPSPNEPYAIGCLGHRRLQWDSYSSLGHHSGGTSEKVLPETVESANERSSADAPRATSATLLPRGTTSGDVFHEIMETLCGNGDTANAPGFKTIGGGKLDELQKSFGAEEETPFVQLVRRTMRKHSVGNREKDGDSTERTLARMVWHALNTPITVGAKRFVLKDVGADDRRAEMEFVIDEKAVLGDRLPRLGGHERDGLFNGKIDLLVRPDGASGPVFVIDWKTNSLGAYAPADLESAMLAAGYDLQYKLYSLAVRQWLGEGKLGGIAYLFVRGGEAPDGSSGVYAKPVSAQFFDDCLTSVKEALPNGKKNEDVKEGEDGDK